MTEPAPSIGQEWARTADPDRTPKRLTEIVDYPDGPRARLHRDGERDSVVKLTQMHGQSNGWTCVSDVDAPAVDHRAKAEQLLAVAVAAPDLGSDGVAAAAAAHATIAPLDHLTRPPAVQSVAPLFDIVKEIRPHAV